MSRTDKTKRAAKQASRQVRRGGRQATFQAKRQVKRATQQAKPWVVSLARFGLAAQGVVYVIVGALAFKAAAGSGSPNISNEQALAQVLAAPFGQLLLVIIAIGLFGYAIWRLVQAYEDPENAGSDPKGIVKRIGWAISGLSYGALGYAAVALATGTSRSTGGGNSSAQSWTARLMAVPFGRWLIGIVGLIIIAVGLAQFYRAYKADFQRRFKLREMNETERKWSVRLGRMGYAAQGVVFTLIGIFLVQAALQYNPQKAGGLGAAFSSLARQPYGPVLLGVVAAGFVAYGLYAVAQARWRRIYV